MKASVPILVVALGAGLWLGIVLLVLKFLGIDIR
jgi:hypothetical protein